MPSIGIAQSTREGCPCICLVKDTWVGSAVRSSNQFNGEERSPVPSGLMLKVARSCSPVAAIQAPEERSASVQLKTSPCISLMISMRACDFIGDALEKRMYWHNVLIFEYGGDLPSDD